jgi:hypothetical protein
VCVCTYHPIQMLTFTYNKWMNVKLSKCRVEFETQKTYLYLKGFIWVIFNKIVDWFRWLNAFQQFHHIFFSSLSNSLFVAYEVICEKVFSFFFNFHVLHVGSCSMFNFHSKINYFFFCSSCLYGCCCQWNELKNEWKKESVEST